MAENPQYQIGDVGANAVVQQGQYLYHVEVKIDNVEDVNALLARLREAGRPPYHGPILRQFDPLVFLNRAGELDELGQFLERDKATVLYVVGLPAIGKSTLVRGALELRRKDVPVVWVTCEGLTADSFFNEVCVGLGLNLDQVMKDPKARVAAKINALLQSVAGSSILVLDGLEALLAEDGQYVSQDMLQIVDSLTTLEHKLKTLATTRTVPTGAGKRVLRLRGISQEQAVKLFEDRTALDAAQVAGLFPEEVWAKLEGHPKFIELLAAAVEEVPVKEIREGLATATDIGDFVLDQVFARTSEEELQVLTALLVFRREASYEALSSVHGELYGGGAAMTKPLKRLVRRNVLEPVGDAQVGGYYLHQMLRDAVPRTKEFETLAHSAAAEWFEGNCLDPARVATYDDVLYHLRQAASVMPSAEHCLSYQNFLFEHCDRLNYGGWARRLIEELSTLISLLRQFEGEQFDDFYARWLLARQYWQLHKLDKADPILRELIEGREEKYRQSPEDEKQGIALWLLLLKATLGDSVVKQKKLDEARALAREIEPLADATEDTSCKLKHRELCYDIARAAEDVEQMSYWGEECFKLAEKQAHDNPSPQTLDVLAEAHFDLAVLNLRKGNMGEVCSHFVAQLQIKLEIRKLSGVAAGLFNLSFVLMPANPAEASAMLLAAREIEDAIGMDETDDFSEDFAEAGRVLKEPGSVEKGRQVLAQISEDLLPYYDAALARLEKGGAPPPAQPSESQDAQ